MIMLIGAITMSLLIWIIAFSMATESDAEHRKAA
jgi:hypothetical protein